MNESATTDAAPQRGRAVFLALAAAILIGMAWAAGHRFGLDRNTGFWLNEVLTGHGADGPMAHSFVSPEELLEFLTQLFLLAPAAALLALAAAPRLAGWSPPAILDCRRWERWLALLVAAATLAVSAGVLGCNPLLVDEVAYWTHSRILLEGQLWLPVADQPGLTANPVMIQTGEKYCSQYYPLWPAMLAPGTALGSPYLVLPLVAAGAFAASLFAWGAAVAPGVRLLAALLLATSPLFLLNAATLLNEVPTLMMLALFVGATLKAEEGGRRGWAAAAGAALGAALIMRPLTALAWAAATSWYALRAGGAAGFLRRQAWATAPVLLAVAGILAYNLALSGEAFQTPYETYDPHCSLGAGVRGEERVEHDLASAGLNWAITGCRMTTWLFGWPFSLLFLPFAFVPGRDPSGRRALWLAIPVAHLAAYLLFFHPGVGLTGPHYFTELAMPLALLSAAGLARAREAAASLASPALRGLPVAAALAMAAVGLSAFWPAKLQTLALLGEYTSRPYRALDASGLRDAVVFLKPVKLPPAQGRMRSTRAVHPQLPDPRGILYLNDPGDAVARARALERYGRGRPAYLYDYRRLLPLTPDT